MTMENKWESEPLGIFKNSANTDVKWRIYYADRTKPNGYYTLSNLESNPELQPLQSLEECK